MPGHSSRSMRGRRRRRSRSSAGSITGGGSSARRPPPRDRSRGDRPAAGGPNARRGPGARDVDRPEDRPKRPQPRAPAHGQQPAGSAARRRGGDAAGPQAARGRVVASGWLIVPASLDVDDGAAITSLLMRRDIETAIVGVGDPAGGDERGSIAELADLAAAAARRRPELGVILAGAMAGEAGRFEGREPRRIDPTSAVASTSPGRLLLAPAATEGSPPGSTLSEILTALGAEPGDSRRAMVRAAAALATVLDRRSRSSRSATRVASGHSRPCSVGEPVESTSTPASSPARRSCRPTLDDALVDAVLGWSTVDDRPTPPPRPAARAPDRPVGRGAGRWRPLRLAAARAALARLVAATPALGFGRAPDVVIAAGGAFAVAPGPAIALAMADVLRRPGASQFAYDHARLLGPLGAIEDPAERQAVVADVADDLLAPIGSVVLRVGSEGRSERRTSRRPRRRPARARSSSSPAASSSSTCPPARRAIAEFQFRDTVMLGTRGRHFAVDVGGGLGGLLVDLRDVPAQAARPPRSPTRAARHLAALAVGRASNDGIRQPILRRVSSMSRCDGSSVRLRSRSSSCMPATGPLVSTGEEIDSRDGAPRATRAIRGSTTFRRSPTGGAGMPAIAGNRPSRPSPAAAFVRRRAASRIRASCSTRRARPLAARVGRAHRPGRVPDRGPRVRRPLRCGDPRSRRPARRSPARSSSGRRPAAGSSSASARRGELRPGAIDVGRAGTILVVGAGSTPSRSRAPGRWACAGSSWPSLAGKDLRDFAASEARQRAGLHRFRRSRSWSSTVPSAGRSPRPIMAIFSALAGREVAIVPDPPSLVFDDPDVVAPAPARRLVGCVTVRTPGARAGGSGSAGLRRFEAGTHLEAGLVRFGEGPPVALPALRPRAVLLIRRVARRRT